jgi:hypothetical protein
MYFLCVTTLATLCTDTNNHQLIEFWQVGTDVPHNSQHQNTKRGWECLQPIPQRRRRRSCPSGEPAGLQDSAIGAGAIIEVWVQYIFLALQLLNIRTRHFYSSQTSEKHVCGFSILPSKHTKSYG